MNRKPIMQAGCPLGHLEVYGAAGKWELHVTWTGQPEVQVLRNATGSQILAELGHLSEQFRDPAYDEIAAPIQAAFRVIAAAGK